MGLHVQKDLAQCSHTIKIINEMLKSTIVRDVLLFEPVSVQQQSMGMLSDVRISSTEQYKSVMLTHHFRKFFPDHPAMVLHQPPSCLGKSGHTHQPDIYICCVKDEYFPERPVLVSDDIDKCIMESACYALGAISTVYRVGSYPVVLSLPICGTTILLRVCFVINGKLCDVQVTECNFAYNDDKAREFLAKL